MNKFFLKALVTHLILFGFLLTACQAELVATVTPTSTPTQAPTATATATPAPTTAPEPIATNAPTETQVPPPALTYPDSYYISNITGHKQTYELGCEASAAVDWAGFFGVSIYESIFQYSLPLSDNPDLGFVGEVTTDAWGQIPPYAYGVHAGPIADALVGFDLPARAVTGYTIEEVKRRVRQAEQFSRRM